MRRFLSFVAIMAALANAVSPASAVDLEDLGLTKTETSVRIGNDTASDTTFVGKEVSEGFSVGGFSTTTVTGGYDDSTGRAQTTTSQGSRSDTSIGVGVQWDF